MIDLLKNKTKYFSEEELKPIQNNKVEKQEKKPILSSSVKVEKKEQLVSVNDYQDLEGVTIGKLNFGFWFIKNKKNFVLIKNLILILIGLFSWGYFFFVFGDYFIFGMGEDQKLSNYLSQNYFPSHDYFQAASANDLLFGKETIFKLDDNKYDLLIEIENPNKFYFAEFDYTFGGKNGNNEVKTNFILPGSKKYLMELGKKFDWYPNDLEFKIIDLRWHRVDTHQYGLWENYKKDRLEGIEIVKKEYVPAEDNILTEKVNLNSLNFEVINNTAFNYENIDFSIVLFGSNGRIATINKYSIQDLFSGGVRYANMTFPGKFGKIQEILILPDVNILNKEIFSEFQGKGFEK